MRCSCRVLPPPLLETSTDCQQCNPHKSPAQPCCSTQCKPHPTCCSLQRLHLTLQCPMACPGLATHTLAGLCALWLPSSAASSSSGNLHKPVKPQLPQTTTCPALPQHPVQAPPLVLPTAEAALNLTVPLYMLRAGHAHTGRAPMRFGCRVLPPPLEICVPR